MIFFLLFSRVVLIIPYACTQIQLYTECSIGYTLVHFLPLDHAPNNILLKYNMKYPLVISRYSHQTIKTSEFFTKYLRKMLPWNNIINPFRNTCPNILDPVAWWIYVRNNKLSVSNTEELVGTPSTNICYTTFLFLYFFVLEIIIRYS